jgi:hypothetical protein
VVHKRGKYKNEVCVIGEEHGPLTLLDITSSGEAAFLIRTSVSNHCFVVSICHLEIHRMDP